ncbi:YpoC family protein [Halalkalibacterium ligniniphilum]|uniref:YpoC family protein n=1 Tax=Halalkalibacterium ligniniphilum TaxID=1134413 RepID=UPI00034BBAC5|nr:hypothetical protein [Halalkalibacterium ligniniphilum]
MTDILVPNPFVRPPFYEKQGTVECSDASFEAIIHSIPFYYDLEGTVAPWKEREHYVPKLFQYWEQSKPALELYYEARNAEAAKEPMLMATAAFVDALFWTNKQPVRKLVDIETDAKALSIKPINIEERLAFLLAAPNKYHSYVQLRAMMDELMKMYYKSVLLAHEKQKNNDGKVEGGALK